MSGHDGLTGSSRWRYLRGSLLVRCWGVDSWCRRWCRCWRGRGFGNDRRSGRRRGGGGGGSGGSSNWFRRGRGRRLGRGRRRHRSRRCRLQGCQRCVLMYGWIGMHADLMTRHVRYGLIHVDEASVDAAPSQERYRGQQSVERAAGVAMSDAPTLNMQLQTKLHNHGWLRRYLETAGSHAYAFLASAPCSLRCRPGAAKLESQGRTHLVRSDPLAVALVIRAFIRATPLDGLRAPWRFHHGARRRGRRRLQRVDQRRRYVERFRYRSREASVER